MTRAEREWLDKIETKIDGIKEDTTELRVTVKGNGGQGHEQRITATELWIKGRMKRIALEIGIISSVVVLINQGIPAIFKAIGG